MKGARNVNLLLALALLLAAQLIAAALVMCTGPANGEPSPIRFIGVLGSILLHLVFLSGAPQFLLLWFVGIKCRLCFMALGWVSGWFFLLAGYFQSYVAEVTWQARTVSEALELSLQAIVSDPISPFVNFYWTTPWQTFFWFAAIGMAVGWFWVVWLGPVYLLPAKRRLSVIELAPPPG